MNQLIQLRDVTKTFHHTDVLKNITIDFKKGFFYTILGPSGCVKSTLLNLIAGFERPNTGDILYNEQIINHVPAHKRKVNTVFQDYALFPHLNVYDNIAFGLKLKKHAKQEIQSKINEALKLVKLEGMADRMIQQLSGGQKQRVAIARAIVNEPEVLLLDESLSALDYHLRQEMQYELRELQSRLGITFIFVTHDQEEALALSDYIYVLNEGRVAQFGTPKAIYDEPLNKFVAQFIGESNIIEGKMIKDYKVSFNQNVFSCVDKGIAPDTKVEVVIRPEDITFVPKRQSVIHVTIDSQLFRGVHYEICCYDQFGQEWIIQSTKKATIGDEVGLYFEPEAIHVMVPNESQEAFDRRTANGEVGNSVLFGRKFSTCLFPSSI